MIFFNRSVDSVIASINRKVKYLEQITKDKQQESEGYREEARLLLLDADLAKVEAVRADRLAHKFAELIS